MVTSDAVLEAVQDEATEDSGRGGRRRRGDRLHRRPQVGANAVAWLILNLTLSLLVALVIEQQTGIISQEPVLAALMPVVASLGGNSGNQSLAVMIRSLASDAVPRAQVGSIMRRHAGTGLLNGLIVALAAAALTYLLLGTGIFSSESDRAELVVIVALAVLVNLLVATLAGTAIPLV